MKLNQLPELKEAILKQSVKEKDKLLVRLINKDKKLIEQLQFLLLENEHDLLKRVQDVKFELEKIFEKTEKDVFKKSFLNKYKELTAYLKSASGLVNEFASITKNKECELDLRLLILEESFDTFFNLYKQNDLNVKSEQHFVYQVNKIKSVLTLYEKLHEDLRYEFNDRLSKILNFAQNSILIEYLNQLNVDYSSFIE